MDMQTKQKIKRSITVFLSFVIAAMSVVSICMRLPEFISEESYIIQMSAAKLSFPNGEEYKIISSSNKNINKNDEGSIQKETKALKEEKKSEGNVKNEDNSGKEKYPVIESNYSSADGSISVKNTTDYYIDTQEVLSQPLGFKLEDTSKPQVLIVHTHTTESYLQEDLGYYYEDYSGRNTDDSENVTMVGQAIVNKLNSRGIGAVQSKTHHDEPTYNGSYDRSEQTICEYLEKYPTIKVIIDIHRDSIGYGGEDGKIKPTFVANGKKAAQIMIMSGYDPTGAYGFSHWEENLRFAMRLQQTAESLYPGMTRPLYFGDFAYNMFINNGSLLIEVGTEVNTIDEAVYTGELLGDVLADVLMQE